MLLNETRTLSRIDEPEKTYRLYDPSASPKSILTNYPLTFSPCHITIQKINMQDNDEK